MARDAVAVYIDDAAIRVLRLSGRRPKGHATEPLSPGLVHDGHIMDEAAVAQQLRSVWSQHSFSSRVVAGISGINCMYRYLTLPELPDDVLPEAVTREASRAFGVPLDQLYISWQKIPGKPGETLVYTAAAARSTVDALFRTLKRAGLNPYMMDIAPLAIARATPEPHGLIVDLQPASLDIVVKMGAMPEVVRSVPLPPSENPEDRLPAVRQELQRAVTFYNSGHPDAPLRDDMPIFVAGQLTDRPELWKEMLGMVERRVDALPSPLEDTEGLSGSGQAVLVGLALKETAGRDARLYLHIDFNALPERYKPKRTPLADLLYIPALVIGIGAVVAAGYVLYLTNARTEALREQAAAKSELAASLGSGITERRATLEEEHATLAVEAEEAESVAQALDSQLRGYETRKAAINDDLGKIHSTPAGVHVGSISHGGDVVNVSGRAATESAVFQYARQLRGTGNFSQTVITSMSFDDYQTAFSMVLYK